MPSCRRVLLVYNEPSLDPSDPNYTQEAGVLVSVSALAEALERNGMGCERLGLQWSLLPLARRLESSPPPDVVVNLCESVAGTTLGEIAVRSLLEVMHVPATGSNSDTLALVRDKARTKWLLRGCGLPTAEFVVIRRFDALPVDALARLLQAGPAIVKPATEDASLGITPHSIGTEMESLRDQIETLRARFGDVLVETYIPGREFNVAILALPEPVVLPIAEIQFEPDPSLPWNIVTYEAKWSAGSAADRATRPICPAKVSDALAATLRTVSLEAFRVTGCRQYARIDLRVTPANEVFILEVNANPDLDPAAGFSRALRAANITYDDFAVRLVNDAMGSYEQAASLDATKRSRDSALQEAARPRDSSKTPHRVRPQVKVRSLLAADLEPLVAILHACNVFRPDEVAVGREVLEEALRVGSSGHYQTLVAEVEGQPVGWSCHGLVPLTDGTWDLYWIAVAPEAQGLGVGRTLIDTIETSLRATQARWLLAETSGHESYRPTHEFYIRTGFAVLSEVADFYRAGDSRILFGKRLDLPRR